MKKNLLNGKLAQNIFILFVLASFIPLLVGSLLSYYQVRLIVQDDALENLQSTSKEYGLLLYSRLKLAKDALINYSDALQTKKIQPEVEESLRNYFAAVAIKQNSPSDENIYGEVPVEVLSKINNSEDKLLTLVGKDGQQRIYIALSSGIFAEFKPTFLWDIDTQNRAVDICVIKQSQEKLYCPSEFEKSELSKAQNKYATKQRSYSDSKTSNKLLVYWSLFLDHEFGVNDWIIVVAQKNNTVDASLKNYKKILIPMVLFSLFLVIFLSSVLIRKNLAVIEKLIQGTKDIVKSNFNKTIEIDSGSEFYELANSFNIMSRNLQKVINEYHYFSEIDKLILVSEKPDKIISTIFNVLLSVVDLKEILLIDLTDDTNYLDRFYYKKAKSNRLFSSNKHISISDLGDLGGLQDEEIQIKKNLNIDIKGINEAWRLTKENICIIPIVDGSRNKYLLLGTTDKIAFDDLMIAKLESFSSRVAAAFQSINRQFLLKYQASHDLLTGIPNKTDAINRYDKKRILIENRLINYAIIFIDLDKFKQVNDNYGHLIGDHLLQSFVLRMKSLLDENDVIIRLSGDEFLINTEAPTEDLLRAKVFRLCGKIIEKAKQAFVIENHSLHIGASIGVSFSPIHGDDFDDLLRYADIAMYFSKKNGGNTHTIYDSSMSNHLLKKALLERDLRTAIENKDIILHYQPKVCAQSYRVLGFEALLRWNHESYGAVSPVLVVETAEQIGMIDSLGNLVLDLSLAQCQEWSEQGHTIGVMAVNISPAQLIQPGFFEFVKATFSKYPLVSPEMVELEITENVMLEQKKKAVAILKKLREFGVGIAIDDFGTGYSSLSYLLDLPANTLKIDRSFVIKIEQDENALALLSSLIKLGKNMGYKIVAEGIETEAQAKFLADCRTDQLQGYLFSRPLPADLVEKRFLFFPGGGMEKQERHSRL